LQSLAPGLQAPQPEYRDLATAAYTLHNIYNALENIFEHTSRTYENHITESSRWHKELLDKMFLQIPQIRPAILPPETRKVMNELRGFRHVFRHSYDFDIDPARLRPLIADWNKTKGLVFVALDFLQSNLLLPHPDEP